MAKIICRGHFIVRDEKINSISIHHTTNQEKASKYKIAINKQKKKTKLCISSKMTTTKKETILERPKL
jgi:hypothetical protein